MGGAAVLKFSSRQQLVTSDKGQQWTKNDCYSEAQGWRVIYLDLSEMTTGVNVTVEHGGRRSNRTN